MKPTLLNIYLLFTKLGLELLGGGYVLVPLISKHLIDKNGWITKEELADYYALSQSLPGIIAANICTFIGYKLKGAIGAAVALTGILTTPVITILCLAEILQQLLEFSYITSIFWGIGISVIVLIYLSVREMWSFSITDKVTAIIFAGAFILSLAFEMSPVLVVILSVIFGLICNVLKERSKE